MKTKQRIRQCIFWLALGTIVLTSIEAISFLFLSISGTGLNPPPTSLPHDQNRTAHPLSYVLDNDRFANSPVQFFEWTKAHPYFGYTKSTDPDRPAGSANNAGFECPIDYPYHGNDGDYVIGIFGGSVALDFYREVSTNTLFIEALRSIPELAGKQIVLLNLSLGGYKQPQQFFAFAYYRDMFDMIITIDGWNELFSWTNPGIPLEYPNKSALLFLARSNLRPRFLADLAMISLLSTGSELLRNFSQKHPVIWYSPTVKLVISRLYRSLSSTVAVATYKLEQRLYPGTTFDSSNLVDTSLNVIDRKIEIWEKYTRLMIDIARAKGIAAFHFLQPSQYIEGAKRLTRAEKKTAYTKEQEDLQRKPLMKIRLKAYKLRDQGYPITDLSDVFRDSDETVFSDPFCHLHPTGHRIIAEAIVRTIANNLADRTEKMER